MKPPFEWPFSQGNPLFSQLDSVLVILDIQEKILQALPHGNLILQKNCFLTQGARLLGIPQILTEQNPIKLGPTVPQLLQDSSTIDPSSTSNLTPPCPNQYFVHQKLSFSALGAKGLQDRLEKSACRSVVVSGIETHICIQQSCLDLASLGYRVGVVADATTSGHHHDHELALMRMAAKGIEILSVESILMEWTRSADNPVFREISNLLKRSRQSFTKVP